MNDATETILGFGFWILIGLGAYWLFTLYNSDPQVEDNGGVPLPSPTSSINCSYEAYNCDDFSSCRQVMRVYNTCSYDVHGLDGDDDGIPCESLCG